MESFPNVIRMFGKTLAEGSKNHIKRYQDVLETLSESVILKNVSRIVWQQNNNNKYVNCFLLLFITICDMKSSSCRDAVAWWLDASVESGICKVNMEIYHNKQGKVVRGIQGYVYFSNLLVWSTSKCFKKCKCWRLNMHNWMICNIDSRAFQSKYPENQIYCCCL